MVIIDYIWQLKYDLSPKHVNSSSNNHIGNTSPYKSDLYIMHVLFPFPFRDMLVPHYASSDNSNELPHG
jgi:hypothetical protein